MDLTGKSSRFIAALAVREGSTDHIQKGLDRLFTSTAYEDFRDVISALVLYNDALNRVGVDADSFLLAYSRSNKQSAEHINSFVARSADLKDLKSGGYRVIYEPEFAYEYNFL